MEILYKEEALGQVEQAINPIRRGRGRPPSLHKKNLVQKLKPSIRRGRGRPRKQSNNQVSKVPRPIIDVLSKQIFKKPRTKTKVSGVSWSCLQVKKMSIHLLNIWKTKVKYRFVICYQVFSDNNYRQQPLEDTKITRSIPNFETSKSCVDGEVLSSLSIASNCVCYQPVSEIEIPGSVPNFDAWEFDDHFLLDFLQDIPDASSNIRGWCKFCRQNETC